jgi:hypothetical protein
VAANYEWRLSHSATRTPSRVRAGHLGSYGWIRTRGEDTSVAAVRETQEELGLVLAANDLRFFQRLTTGTLIQDVWLVALPEASRPTLIIGPEMAAVR